MMSKSEAYSQMMSKSEPVRLFISYAHEDKPLRKQLQKHLSLLQQQGLVSTWQDRRIMAGTNWAQQIDEHLKSASIILLLISADFLASNYCYGIEMQCALDRDKAGQVRVIPILVRPCDQKGAPFAHLQVLPTNDKAITTWNNRDEAWANVVRGIREVVNQIQLQSFSILQQSASSEEKQRSMETSPNRDNWADGGALGERVGSLARKNQWAQAEATARQIPSSQEKSLILLKLINAMMQAEQWERARGIAFSFEDPSHKREALAQLAERLIETKQWEQALAIIYAIDLPSVRSHLLSKFSKATELVKEWENRAPLLADAGMVASNPAKTLVTAVCRNICKKIALVSKFFRPEKLRYPSEGTRFVATSTARGRYRGLGGVSVASAAQPKRLFKIGRKRSAVFTVSLFCGLVIVLASVLFNTISQSRNPNQSAATSTIPPQSTSSVNVPVFGFDTQRTHFNPSEHLLSPSTITSLKPHWTANIGTGIAETFFPSSPAVVNGVVYVGSWDHKLYALDTSTGKILWSAQTGDHITSSPAVVNGVVYVGSWDHKLYAFRADGCVQFACSPLWASAPTGNSIFSSPVVDNGTVYVGSQDGKLYAFKTDGCDGNKSSCDPLWSVQIGTSITSSPAVDHGVVYVGSWDHKLYALDAATHTIKWSYPTGDIVWSSPTVANGLIYSGSADKKLYALDAKTGVLKWEYTTGNAIHSSPAVAHGVVYIGSYDGQLYALNASTGKLFWKSVSVEAAFFSSPTIANGLVYLSSNNRTFSIYNASGCGNSQTTCDPLWTSSRLSGPILSSPTVVNGAIYLSSQDGKLYAFHLLGAIP